MKTRVTLTLEPEAHLKAKRLAKARRTSVSALINDAINQLDRADTRESEGDLIAAITGCASLPDVVKNRATDPRLDVLLKKYVDDGT